MAVPSTPVLVNTSLPASGAAAPATFAAAITASTAGNFMVCFAVSAMSAAGSVSAPSGWTPVPLATVGNAAIRCDTFIYPNNPGALSTINFATLTNVNGIAVVCYEFSGLTALDTTFIEANISAGATTLAGTVYAPKVANSAMIACIGNLASQSLTTSAAPAIGSTPFAYVASGNATSTLGATNARARGLFATTATTFNTNQAGLTNGASVACVEVMIVVSSLASGALYSMGSYGGLGVYQGSAGVGVA